MKGAGFRLSPELERRLERLSEKTERPKSFYMRKALMQFLDENERLLIEHHAKEPKAKKSKRV